MQIQGIDLDISKHYLDPVTYVPPHAFDNPNHWESNKGVIIRRNEHFVFVLFCKSRTVQAVNPDDLIWG